MLAWRVLTGDEAFTAWFAELRRLVRSIFVSIALRERIDAKTCCKCTSCGTTLEAFATSQPMTFFAWIRLIVGQTLVDLHHGISTRNAMPDGNARSAAA
jgi:hypothetical protein